MRVCGGIFMVWWIFVGVGVFFGFAGVGFGLVLARKAPFLGNGKRAPQNSFKFVLPAPKLHVEK